MQFVIPYLLGWHTFANAIKPEDSFRSNNARSGPELEWGRWSRWYQTTEEAYSTVSRWCISWKLTWGEKFADPVAICNEIYCYSDVKWEEILWVCVGIAAVDAVSCLLISGATETLFFSRHCSKITS